MSAKKLIREYIEKARAHGLPVMAASEAGPDFDECDISICQIGCKVKKHTLPAALKINDMVDARILKSDDQDYILIPFSDFLGMLKGFENAKNQ